MAANSAIEWTDATWNCLAGCEAVSPGCAHCYAASMTRRLEAMGQKNYAGLTTAKHFNGKVRCLPDKLDVPLRWRQSRRVFVNSMSDLFHEHVPDEFIDKVFAVMAVCPQHTFQVLTKRAERMANYGTRVGMAMRIASQAKTDYGRTPPQQWPLQNVWLGVSAEDQKRADERIPWLLRTPSAVRFVSAEPLLGPINIREHLLDHRGYFANVDSIVCGGKEYKKRPGLDWVIVGGESGPRARPMDPDWVRSLRDQCIAAGVPFFFKQWGEWLPALQDGAPDHPNGQHINISDEPDRVGKKAAGRLLDGREWNEFPRAHVRQMPEAAHEA